MIKYLKKKCAVCGNKYMADVYDQGECSYCGWYNGTIYFKDKEDFIKNAKIDNEYVRDIWDKVENPCYL